MFVFVKVIGSQKLQTAVITVGRLRDSLEQTRAPWRRAEGRGGGGVDLDALQLDDDVTQIHSQKKKKRLKVRQIIMMHK